jgi:hypothetical protein
MPSGGRLPPGRRVVRIVGAVDAPATGDHDALRAPADVPSSA